MATSIQYAENEIGLSEEFSKTLKSLRKKLVKKPTKGNKWRKTAEEFKELIFNLRKSDKVQLKIMIELFETYQNYLAFGSEVPPLISMPILYRICLTYFNLKLGNEALILRKKWLKYLLNQSQTQNLQNFKEYCHYPYNFITAECSEFVQFSDLDYERKKLS